MSSSCSSSYLSKPINSRKTGSIPAHLPFPLPFIGHQGQLIWPLRCKGQPYFFATLKPDLGYVLVTDPTSARAIYSMGYFGEKGSFTPLASVYQKDMAMDYGSDTHDGQQIEDHHRSSKQMMSLNNAFQSIEDKHDLIEDLYCSSESRTKSSIKGQSSSSRSSLIANKSSSKSEHDLILLNDADRFDSLKLSFEEAFFLSYGLGVLIVFGNDEKTPLDLNDLWLTFSRLKNGIEPNFPISYCAYHYFRSKGWIVKSGLKYGCNYNLYKEGPPFYHSLFSVIVLNQFDDEIKESLIDWRLLIGFHRLSKGVNKHPLLCYVILPRTLHKEDFNSPKIIKKFQIKSILIERWVPTEKDEENDSD